MKNIITFKKIKLNMLNNAYFAYCLAFAASFLCVIDTSTSANPIPREVTDIIASYASIPHLLATASIPLHHLNPSNRSRTIINSAQQEIAVTTVGPNPTPLASGLPFCAHVVTYKPAQDNSLRQATSTFFTLGLPAFQRAAYNIERSKKLDHNNQSLLKMMFGSIIPDKFDSASSTVDLKNRLVATCDNGTLRIYSVKCEDAVYYAINKQF